MKKLNTHYIVIKDHKLGINVFVHDKDGKLVARHNFCADNEDVIRAAVNSFEYAMETYAKDYIVHCSPIHFIF